MSIIKRAKQRSFSILFTCINTVLMICSAAICVIPFIHMVAMSFSSTHMVAAGKVFMWPKDFTFASYEYVMHRVQFWKSALISIKRVILAVPINILLTVLSAYPLSRPTNNFRARTFFAWFFFITTIFSGGLIPLYMVVVTCGMLNSLWALVLPSAVPVGNILLMLNFFKQTPSELHDAALIDGVGHWRMLFQIYIPLSKASLATITLFQFIGHWNAWFDGMIYMSRQNLYPLQTFIRNITAITQDITLLTPEEQALLSKISDRTMQSAQIMIATIPIILVYPFLQRYFVKGLTLGSIKG